MKKEEEDIIHIPVEGILDLHTFPPREIGDLLEEYIRVCLENGIYEVKIIHGKGRGTLRRKVHAILKKNPLVMEFRLDSGPSGWGASIATLRNPSKQ